MEKTEIFKIRSLYRDDFRITGYRFGNGNKSMAIVGSLRGDEFQQIYMCSMLVKKLKELEKQGTIEKDNEILVIPSLNPHSMNIGKRFWPTDNTDINRMFPGYSLGETTQRIAAGVFDVVSKYGIGIQFASFYMPGRYLPHVNIMKTGFENEKKACEFELPYVLVRSPRPYDTTTLNYNWQIWETEAYSLYSTTTSVIDEEGAKLTVDSVIRFMTAEGMLKGAESDYIAADKSNSEPTAYRNKDSVRTQGRTVNKRSVEISRVLTDNDMYSIRPEKAGIFKSTVNVGDKVKKGDTIAFIQDVYEGDIIEELKTAHDGTIFFLHDEPLTYANTAVCKIIK